MEKDVLKGAVCYLAGAIDNASDDGIGWRQKLRKLLKDREIDIKFLDPTDKVGGYAQEVGEEKRRNEDLRDSERWEELTKIMKSIVRLDLRQIDISDFVILKVDTSLHMCGSYSEASLADQQHKPVLVITKGGKKKTPTWLFGILDHNLFFDTEEDCVDYLELINSGRIKLSDKWVLIRKYI